jgi:hypothetical protein
MGPSAKVNERYDESVLVLDRIDDRFHYIFISKGLVSNSPGHQPELIIDMMNMFWSLVELMSGGLIINYCYVAQSPFFAWAIGQS